MTDLTLLPLTPIMGNGTAPLQPLEVADAANRIAFLCLTEFSSRATQRYDLRRMPGGGWVSNSSNKTTTVRVGNINNADVAANQVFTKLSEAGIAVDLKNYNPISSAAGAGGADVTAAAVDALGAQMQATINALGAMLEGVSDINSADPHSDAVDAMVAAINSAGAAGTSIDFGSVTDITSILNQSALGSGSYATAVASVSQALAEVNKQLYELFTEEGGNFLDADARGMALMAQTDLIDAISEFAAMPRSADAAGSLEARFDLVDDAGNVAL